MEEKHHESQKKIRQLEGIEKQKGYVAKCRKGPWLQLQFPQGWWPKPHPGGKQS